MHHLQPLDRSEIFKLMNEIDFDELVNTLELVIERFSDQMGTYCVAICTKLVSACPGYPTDFQSNAFLRMANQDDDEDSAIAAMECLGAIQTILDSIHELPHLYPQVNCCTFFSFDFNRLKKFSYRWLIN